MEPVTNLVELRFLWLTDFSGLQWEVERITGTFQGLSFHPVTHTFQLHMALVCHLGSPACPIWARIVVL